MRRVLLFLVLLVLGVCAVDAVSIPMVGNVSIGFSINARVGASFENKLTSDSTFNLQDATGNLGQVRVQVILDEQKAVSPTIYQNGNNVGSANFLPNAVNDTLDIGMQLNVFESLANWKRFSRSFENQFLYDLSDGNKSVGKLVVTFTFTRLAQGENAGEVSLGGSPAGSINVINTARPIISDIPTGTNYFAGFVRTRGNKTVTSGTVKVVSMSGVSRSVIIPIGDLGGYGFNSTLATGSGPIGSLVMFYVDDQQVRNETISADTSVRRVDLVIRTSGDNFEDEDHDGVPDEFDTCPHSSSTVVDANGCTCEQRSELEGAKKQSGGLLSVQGPSAPAATCDVSAAQGPRTQGGAGTRRCATPNKCLNPGVSPQYCNSNNLVVMNCTGCGCPSDFTCATADATDDRFCPEGKECVNDEGCYQEVKTKGQKCLTNDFLLAPHLECSKLGPSYLDFFANDTLHRNMNDFVFLDADEGPFGIGKDAMKQVRHQLQSYVLCVNTTDLGCVPFDVKCPEQTILKRNKEEIGRILNNELQKVMGESTVEGDIGATTLEVQKEWGKYPPWIISNLVASIVGPILGAFFSDVDVSYYFNAQQLHDIYSSGQYACDNVILPWNESCKPMITEGDPADKINVFIIGDGFASDAELNATVSSMLDISQNSSGTAKEGLFSRDPFRKRKSQFNFWMIATNTLGHEVNKVDVAAGARPKLSDVYHLMLGCSNRDMTIVVSKDAKYRSDCSPGLPCFISLSEEPFPGRELLRVMGRFFGLADEFYFKTQLRDSPNVIEELNYVGVLASPNCKESQYGAEKGWIALRAQHSEVGFFKPCGGRCGAQCVQYIRPTFNSVMNNYTAYCPLNGTGCKQGPPFDPYYAVDQQAIEKGLSVLGVAQDENDTTMTANVSVPSNISSGTQVPTP